VRPVQEETDASIAELRDIVNAIDGALVRYRRELYELGETIQVLTERGNRYAAQIAAYEAERAELEE
jgi:chromosome segregation ATPase